MAVLQAQATLKIHRSNMAMEERRAPAILTSSKPLPSKTLKDSTLPLPLKVRTHTLIVLKD